MRTIIGTAFFLLLTATAFAAADTTEFFVVAHPDDWQLFMGLDAYRAMTDSNKHVVIIHTTSGDASYNAPAPDRKFYTARERGAVASLEFCMDIERYHTREYFDTVWINKHPVLKFEYKNVVNYFLRLPDGCGQTGLHGQSLEYLQRGLRSRITAVDSSATYYGWQDLVRTVHAIFAQEGYGSPVTRLNTPDTSAADNPGDHPDHIYTGRLALEAADGCNNMAKRLFVDYHVEKLPINLSHEEVALKACIYGVVEFSRSQSATSNSWCKGHIDFLCRRYFRSIPSVVDSVLHSPVIRTGAVLYPNPTTGSINIACHLPQAGELRIDITSISGQVMLPTIIRQLGSGAYNTEIDVSGFIPGSYIATIRTGSQQQAIPFVRR